MADVG